jgi:uncharacterized membrane protein
LRQIVFDRTHDEAISISNEKVSGYFSFACELGKLGYITRQTEKALSRELESSDVLVVAFPQKEFYPEEGKTIRDFVENGGGLLLIGEWANLKGVADCLNSLSEQFGVKFENNRLTDFDDKYRRSDDLMEEVLGPGDMPFMLKLIDFVEHPITSEIKSIGYFAGCTLETDKENALVWTDETCFADHRIDEIHQISEEEGPFILAAFKEIGNGRVVFIGDTSPFSNRFLHTEDNMNFGTQILRWLAKDI